MFNRKFAFSNKESKIEKLEKILKKNGVVAEEIKSIVEKIDFTSEYIVKVTSDIARFKYLIANEKVQKEGMLFASHTSSVYGEFYPGYYRRIGNNIKQADSICDSDKLMVAMKHLSEDKEGKYRSINILIIYVPPGRVKEYKNHV